MVNIKRDGQAYDHKNKDKDIAIDSELLGDQLSYGGSGNGQDTGHQHKEDDDDDVAAAAAASLVI